MKLITALATPFLKGEIDLDSFKRLVATQGEADALLCVGTTAEAALLTDVEKLLLIETTKKLTTKKVWAGISEGTTEKAVKEARAAKCAGADGLLISPPSFFKCTEEGYVQHVQKILQATDLPIMLYNAPSRCGYNLWHGAMCRLAEIGVRFVKDAGSQADFCKHTPLETFCGNEEKLWEFANHGATGIVSVVSNANAPLTKRAGNCAARGETAASGEEIRAEFEKLANLLFCEINPIPVKYMLYRMGIFQSDEMRLPLTSAQPETRHRIDEYLYGRKLL